MRLRENKALRIVSVVVFFLALVVAFVLINGYHVDLTIDKPEYMELNVGDEFELVTASARFSGRIHCKDGVVLDVKVKGNVDTDKLGTYNVEYKAGRFLWSKKIVQKVEVKDTTAPQITLNMIEEQVTLPGEKYKEEGYSAVDNYDGDITDKVTTEEKDGVVYYTVTDSSGNTACVERKIVYYDPVAPVIVLQGSQIINIKQGQSYTEPGYTVTDNYENLNDKVVVSGSVDTGTVGSYNITYTVKDSYGNEATAVRTVVVSQLRQTSTDSAGKIVYLTFDDGPGPYTQKLLNILDKYNVKVTFFVVNSGYNNLIGKAAAAGHSIGIHSYTHDYYKIYASEDAYFDDLNLMHNVIKEQTGKTTQLVRFPGGSSNTISGFNKGIMTRLTKRVRDMGYQYFDWNVSSGDAGGTTDTKQVYNNVVAGIRNHNVSVVLQHDIKGFSVDAVEDIIIWGLNNGYTFLPLDESSTGAHHGVNN